MLIYECISEINNSQIDNAKNIGRVMLLYNLTKYSDNYLKISRSLWQHCRDEPFWDDDNAIVDFPANDNSSASFRCKAKIASSIGNNDIKDVRLMVPLKYLSNF